MASTTIEPSEYSLIMWSVFFKGIDVKMGKTYHWRQTCLAIARKYLMGNFNLDYLISAERHWLHVLTTQK